METRKEKIRELFKKVIYKDGDIYVFYSKKAMDKLINDILAIPLDVMSEEEIEKKYSGSPNNHLHPNRFRKEGAVWAIEQVKERNQK